MVTKPVGRLGGRTIPVRTHKDLNLVADKLSSMFDTEVVVVVGSQAVLVGWPNAPEGLRGSDEIDAYPANAAAWEKAVNSAVAAGEPSEEASERINALCGEGSTFHEQWGFYIDGVNDRTSPLPRRWQERAVYREANTPRGTVTIVAPCAEDMIATKLTRLLDKDRDFIGLYHFFRPLDVAEMKTKVLTCDVPKANKEAAFQFLDSLPKADLQSRREGLESLGRYMPEYPSGSHCAFYNAADHTVIVRKWDEAKGLYYKIDNPLGPAIAGKRTTRHFLDGKAIDAQEWENHPRVAAARQGAEEPKPDWAGA